MILIGDGGSTRTDWGIILHDGTINYLSTEGINPYFARKEMIVSVLKKVAEEVAPWGQIMKVFYYGAGCSRDEKKREVETAFRQVFTQAKILVSSDLMGACLSLFGDQPGIACILGTGSNACYFNGEKIEEQQPSLGYTLGDEGSGNYLGKLLLKQYFYRMLPGDLHQKFEKAFPLNYQEVMDHTYHSGYPNRYFAGFTPFLSANITHTYIYDFVKKGLSDFFYHQLNFFIKHNLPVGFVGGIAYEFCNILKELIKENGFALYRIEKNALPGLMKYFLEK